MGDMVACRSIVSGKWPDAWRMPADWWHRWSRIGDGRRRDFPALPVWTSDPPDARPLPPETLAMGIFGNGGRARRDVCWGGFASLCLSMTTVVFGVCVCCCQIRVAMCCLAKSS